MDIYRFFHPHHNPRLHSTPVRQQELSELEQAAAELRKALERARLRTMRAVASNRILPAHFDDVIKAIRFVEASMQTLCDAHEGDNERALDDLIKERSSLSGWEAWTALVREQLGGDTHEEAVDDDEGPVVDSEPVSSRSANRHRYPVPPSRLTSREPLTKRKNRRDSAVRPRRQAKVG